MTDREKAVVMASTGICMLKGEKLDVFYRYLAELFGRPVYTHEWLALESDIKEKSKPDFLELCREEEPERNAERWIPVAERLPDNQVSCIVCYREWNAYLKRNVYGIVVGWYVRKHCVKETEFSEWEGDCDYYEEEDDFYIHGGWYEQTTQGNLELMNWYINGEVIAWMPLPEPWEGNK